MGKLPPALMEKYVYSRLGVRDPAVIVGPQVGEDSAVIDLGDGRVLVVHADGITGAVELLGWLAVHIVSNDIAVTGARPRWYLATLYLPEDADERVIDKITEQMDRAAREIGVMIVGGHTEFTPRLERPLVATTAIGVVDKGRFVRTSGAKPGDLVVMTKTAGIEGTAILASDFKDELLRKGVGEAVLERARGFLERVSVVREALLLAENKLVTSMHDPTEGGLLGGLSEIAYASGTTIEAWEEKIPVAPETREICRALGIDPLRLISSGVLVATVPREKAEKALGLLEREGLQASIIGEVVERRGNTLVVLHRSNGSTEELDSVYVHDELIRLWEEYKRGG
ncbi:MAG: AIR synthase family protein [Pyrodictiaceae archaeon]